MRTVIELPEEQIKKLAQIAAKEQVSRAELIRRAVAYFTHQYQDQGKNTLEAFGLWKSRKLDSCTYQEKLRKEWESKVKALFDTNILIDYLKGIPQAKQELEQYPVKAISLITWIEVLIGSHSSEEEQILMRFLNSFQLELIYPEVALRAVNLRRQFKLKIPDAIIWSNALEKDYIFITRNTKDFPSEHPTIRIPYKI